MLIHSNWSRLRCARVISTWEPGVQRLRRLFGKKLRRYGQGVVRLIKRRSRLVAVSAD